MESRKNPGSGSPESIERMEALIPTFNMVMDLLVKTNEGEDSASEIQFPQIVTVGSQSAGKSSVLENLVGHSFLPRGTGIVTRCPIVLRLVNTPGSKIWCELDHLPGQKFTDFKQVEQEIMKETNVIAGTNLGITKQSIKVTFFSPDVLNLTVVDLPGLVQIPVGDQPADISAQIRDLVKSYISQENSIILAISPGNVDIATSESILFAKEVDPKQERTIVVLTKLDLADDKERMTEVLKGNVVPVRLGIVGVINRSQEDSYAGKSLGDVIEYEKNYLRNNYPSIANQNGVPFLAKKLNKILHKHIASSCGGLMSRVRQLTATSEEELEALGDNEDLSDDEKRLQMIAIIDEFSKLYKSHVDGQQRSEIGASSLSKGTGLNFILQDRLHAELNSLGPFERMGSDAILIAIRNAMPVGARMIIPEVALNHFVQEEIKRMSPLSIDIAALSYQEMVGMIGNCLKENNRFPKVNPAIHSVVTEVLTEKMKTTKDILTTYFEVQSASALTADPEFNEMFKEKMSRIGVVDMGVLPKSFGQSPADHKRLCTLSNASTFTPDGPTAFSEPQLTLCTEMKALAKALFEIVRWQAQDFITKAILSALIYKTVDKVQIALNMELNSFEKIEDLIREPEDIHTRRVYLRQKIQEYSKALQLIEDVVNDAV